MLSRFERITKINVDLERLFVYNIIINEQTFLGDDNDEIKKNYNSK